MNKEIQRRIAIDFNKTRDDIKNELSIYIEDINNEQIDEYTNNGDLENISIDGKVYYFHSAVKNMFRTKPQLRGILLDIEGRERAGRQYILSKHIPLVIEETIDNIISMKPLISSLPITPIYGEFDPMNIFKRNIITLDNSFLQYLSQPHQWNFYCRTTVDADAVPDGEEIRCWMPMPRMDVGRQEYFADEISIEDDSVHACKYLTKNAVNGKPTIFTNKFSFTSYAEYHPLPEDFEHKDINKTPDLEEFLKEQAPHIVFSEDMRSMAEKIIGNEKRPYFKARLIFEAMRTMYPWASAREYSTIENIPQYVVSQGHGDCGQIALLFITLCRIVNIPARWQSGFMLHPGYDNFHDWAEILIEDMGWIPVDPSFGVQNWGKNDSEKYFYFGGIDAFRLVVNSNYGGELKPKKLHIRSETVDFQRGEVEWENENLYFDKWKFNFWVEPII